MLWLWLWLLSLLFKWSGTGSTGLTGPFPFSGHALQGVYSVERYKEGPQGERYFLDMSLQSKESGRAFRVAEYAYKRQ